MEDVVYVLDGEDRIVATNEVWDRFAAANGAPELRGLGTHGRVLWDYVDGAAVREALRILLAGVKRRGGVRRLPFRCDAPDRRRFMEMDVEPGPSGGVTVRTRVLREEPRDAVPSTSAAAGRTISVCAWCLRVRVDGGWEEPEQGVRTLDLLTGRPFQVSHGICPVCEATLTA